MVRISTKLNALILTLFLNAQTTIKQDSETYLLPKCGDRLLHGTHKFRLSPFVRGALSYIRRRCQVNATSYFNLPQKELQPLGESFI